MGRLRFGASLSVVMIVACGGHRAPPPELPPPPPPRAASSAPVRTWNPEGLSSDGDYPPRYPLLDDAELARRTAAAEAATPGWHVIVNSLGLLHVATCKEACPGAADAAPSTEDQAKVEEFLAKNDALVAASGPNVSLKTPNEKTINYTQSGPYGSAASVRVSRTPQGLAITGHLWPTLPTAAPKPEVDVERALRRLESGEDLVVRRGYRLVAQTLRGPAELRLSACYSRVSEEQRTGPRPKHACVDAHTAEDITEYLVVTQAYVTNGVTKRHLARPFKD